MNSIRTKMALLTVCVIVVTMAVTTWLSVSAIRNIGNTSSDEMLMLLCESGQKNLDSYFESVEQSVDMVASFADENLRSMATLDDAHMKEHIDAVNTVFESVAQKTNGVLTYYYRIDPAVSQTEKGFWFTNLSGDAFEEHEVTDITLYDTQDTSKLVWFTVPKATGKPIWLPPYITDNLDVRVISYNAPIYRGGQFIGVIGIEIDYTTMANLVDSIELYQDGYAFINDDEGTIIYHPHIDVAELSENHPKVPDGLLSESPFVTYSYEGVEKQAVWLPLSNGMRLNVTVPTAEINASWLNLVYEILAVSLVLLVVFIIVTMRFTGHITKPLRELTEVAKQVDAGNYDVKLDYDENDEVGILTRTVNTLVGHLKTYIGDLNSLAYADALTSVRNKGAFDIFMRDLQAKCDGLGEPGAAGEGEEGGKPGEAGEDGEDGEDGEAGEAGKAGEPLEFAVGVFDCDGLKRINDLYGHDKGNIYLKTACHFICQVFQHSPVFRVGGDEFAVILQHDDFHNRDELVRRFEEGSAELSANASAEWEEIHVSVGIAVYDPVDDASVSDVTRRADKLMYEHKRQRRAAR